MNAVIYARFSSDRQREESIEGQLRECTDYAMRNNYTLIGRYIDRALSARTADRLDFQRMIADGAHYKHVLKKNGVRVISIKENISHGPEGIILESMLKGYAEYYSAELSQKIRRGQHDNAMKCMNNGDNIPLGYGIPAIIDKELFERVQKRMEANKKAPARSKAAEEYLLTTKLFCGDCGRLMTGESGKGCKGIIYHYYKCSGAKRRLGCKKKRSRFFCSVSYLVIRSATQMPPK